MTVFGAKVKSGLDFDQEMCVHNDFLLKKQFLHAKAWVWYDGKMSRSAVIGHTHKNIYAVGEIWAYPRKAAQCVIKAAIFLKMRVWCRASLQTRVSMSISSFLQSTNTSSFLLHDLPSVCPEEGSRCRYRSRHLLKSVSQCPQTLQPSLRHWEAHPSRVYPRFGTSLHATALEWVACIPLFRCSMKLSYEKAHECRDVDAIVFWPCASSSGERSTLPSTDPLSSSSFQ